MDPIGDNRRSAGRQPSLKPASDRRFSVQFPSSDRKRSSVFKTADKSVPKDTRPVTDKEYQNKMIRKILQVVGHEVQEDAVRSPSRKDFVAMFELIYRHIDPDFKMEPKIEEQVPKLMKNLGYPVMLKPATLLSLSAPTSWPHLLAALGWLIDIVEVLTVMRKSTHSKFMGEEESDGYVKTHLYAFSSSQFKEYKKTADSMRDPRYPLEDEERERIRSKLKRVLEERLDGDPEDTQTAIRDTLEEIKHISSEENNIASLTKEIAMIKDDISTIEMHNNTLEANKAQMADEEEYEKRRLEIINRLLTESNLTLEEKKALLERQASSMGIDGPTARKLAMEMTRSHQQLKTLHKEITAIRQEKLKISHTFNSLFTQEQARFRKLASEARSLTANLPSSRFAHPEVPRDVAALHAAVSGPAHRFVSTVREEIRTAMLNTSMEKKRVIAAMERNAEAEARQNDILKSLLRDSDREERMRRREIDQWLGQQDDLQKILENIKNEIELHQDQRHEVDALKQEKAKLQRELEALKQHLKEKANELDRSLLAKGTPMLESISLMQSHRQTMEQQVTQIKETWKAFCNN